MILVWRPELYSPLASFLISTLQAGYTAWLSYAITDSSARKSANAKWLPQAEGACDRLLTVSSSIQRYRQQLQAACGHATKNLPELQQNNMKAVRVLMERQCAEGANMLLDMANHMESAVSDWRRFIGQNCEGAECAAIDERLSALRERLREVDQSCVNDLNVDVQAPEQGLSESLRDLLGQGETKVKST
jgi:hypothetical protein